MVNPVGFKKNHFSLESWIKRSFTQLCTINENIDCIVLIWSHSPTSFTPIKQSNRTKDQSKPNKKEEDEAYRVLLLAVNSIDSEYLGCCWQGSLIN